MDLYDWQKEFINWNGDVALKGGRQIGKSIAAASRIKRLLLEYPGCTILLISPSERQENFIYEKFRQLFKKTDFKKRVTLHHALHRNGSQVFKFPVGPSGIYVEGLSSVDFLVVDEAIRMPDEVWDAILPMLAEPKKRGLGWITMLGNTRGKPEGLFRDAFKENSGYKTFAKSSEDCPHIDKEFLKKEKERLGDLRYRMIYLGEFVEWDYKYFHLELLQKVFNEKSWTLAGNYNKANKYVLGIDPARFGRDKAAFVIGEIEKDKIKIIHSLTIKKSSILDLFHQTLELESKFKFNQIFVDGGGVGGGLVDFLQVNFKNKIVDLNNAKKGEMGGTLLKEDLYSNALMLMETGKLKGVFNQELINSLNNVSFDGEEFSGKQTDLAEAFIRACWGTKTKRYEPKIV